MAAEGGRVVKWVYCYGHVGLAGYGWALEVVLQRGGRVHREGRGKVGSSRWTDRSG